jgi:tetratricopeptide (TPR) repeat protein
VIAIDTTLHDKEPDRLKRQALEQEIIGLLLKNHEKSGDPFYYYRIGQSYLKFGNKKEAQRYFNEAYLNSPDGTHYKLAAKKLAERLNQ